MEFHYHNKKNQHINYIRCLLLLIVLICFPLKICSDFALPIPNITNSQEAFALPTPNLTFNPILPIAYAYPGGSIELRVQYSYLFKDVYAINFNQLLGLQNAVSLKIEYGGDENRLNATWGAALSKHQLFKVTVERLTQNLPFYFDSGQINKNVSQNAYGGTVH